MDILDHLLPEQVGESVPGARKRHLHRSLRRAEDVLDLGDRPILEVEEHDGDLLGHGELPHRPQQVDVDRG